MTETAMSHAFARVKLKGPAARLRDLAVEALDASVDETEPNESPLDEAAPTRLKEWAKMSIDHADFNMNVATGLLLAELMNDAQALNALMGDAVRKRAAEYLHQVFNEEFVHKNVHVQQHERMKPARKSDGHGHYETPGAGAVRSGGGQYQHEAQNAGVPAAHSPERIAAAKVAMGIVAKSWFDREMLGSRAIGDQTYDEIRIGALRARDQGMRDLRQAYIGVRLLKGVARHEGMASIPAREWADENAIAAASERFDAFGHLLTGEIDDFLKVEYQDG